MDGTGSPALTIDLADEERARAEVALPLLR
jgi:hypothetical protein